MRKEERGGEAKRGRNLTIRKRRGCKSNLKNEEGKQRRQEREWEEKERRLQIHQCSSQHGGREKAGNKTWTQRDRIFRLHYPRFSVEIQQINQESPSESVSTNGRRRFIASSQWDTPPSGLAPPTRLRETPTLNSLKLDQL